MKFKHTITAGNGGPRRAPARVPPTSSVQVLRFLLILLLGVASADNVSANWPFAPPNRKQSCARDHVIIKFKHGERAKAAVLAGTNELTFLLRALQLPAGAELIRTAGENAQREETEAQAEPNVATDIDRERHLYLRLPADWSVEECVRRLAGHPAVEYLEPDCITRAALLTPNDPQFQLQWYHLNTFSNGNLRADIHTPEAWEITRGSTNVILGLLDTGINAALPDFVGRVVPGYNFVSGNTNTADDHFHGTAIASIAAATGQNASGIAGVDWNCKLMPIKVLNSGDAGVASWYVDGLDWARTHGCKVVNLSFASDQPSEMVTRAISNAIAAGIVVVALADNGGFPAVSFPGSLTNVITVGSTDRRDLWAVSNYGPQIDVVAPGADMAFLYLDGSVTSGSGNSASVPLVSAVATLLASVRPGLTHEMAQTLLAAGADDMVGDFRDTPGYDQHYGWGRLNAYNSVVLARCNIQRLEMTTNGNVRLSWECPPNAASKRPYRIETGNSPRGPWTLLAQSSNIVYQVPRASWVDEIQTAGGVNPASRFYRLRVVAE